MEIIIPLNPKHLFSRARPKISKVALCREGIYKLQKGKRRALPILTPLLSP